MFGSKLYIITVSCSKRLQLITLLLLFFGSILNPKWAQGLTSFFIYKEAVISVEVMVTTFNFFKD